MNRSHERRPGLLLTTAAAAVAASLLSASTGLAQYRTGADGHALDANSRLGSGGYNSGADASNRSGLNYQITTGNVSGLNYFHNGHGTFDPNQLQINDNDRVFERFNQAAAPVYPNQRSTGQSNFTPYYNAQRYVGPTPPNLTTTSNGVGLVPAPRVSAETPSSDTRLQTLNNSPLDQGSNLPPPGGLDEPGPVNPVGNQSLYTMSPLYGVRQLQPNDPNDNLFLSRYGNGDRPGAGPKLDAASIQGLRDELRTSAVGDQPKPDGSPTNAGIGGAPADQSVGRTAQPGAIGAGDVSARPLGGAAFGSQPVTSTVGSSLSTLSQTVQIPPGQQSRQLAELERRFAAANPKPNAVQQSVQNQRILDLLKSQQAKAGTPTAGRGTNAPAAVPAQGARQQTSAGGRLLAPPVPGGGPAATPAASTAHPAAGQPMAPVLTDPSAAEAGTSNQPFVITSLATGIRAKGLADLLKSAEGQMRDGQFGQAVDTYDTAGEVAPNNPFVPLGRSFAELGASYYGKAEADLTRAIFAEPALLAGRYDLQGFLGRDRLQFIQQKDLPDIGRSEQTARPFLLLAYIDHNTGKDDATVARSLDEAARRGADAKLVDLMRQAWDLKPAGK